MISHQLLTFWFGELQDGLADEAHRKRWYAPDPEFDAVCRAQFENQLLSISQQGPVSHLLSTPQETLAHIVLLDQIPRNIFRGSANAFAWDSQALNLAKAGIELGQDRQLAWDERAFFYMPFEHSENLLDQHTAVGLFSQLRDQSSGRAREITGSNLRYAQQHRDIIQKFGRFPHRNGVLARTSTQSEADFVAGSDGFGQLPSG